MIILQELSQRNNRWQDKTLGSSDSLTIGEAGCLVTCLAMVANYYGEDETPATINAKLKTVNGFYKKVLYNNKIAQVFPYLRERKTETPQPLSPSQLQEIRESLADQNPVIVKVDFSSKRGLQSHFVVLTGWDEEAETFTCVDPWSGKNIRLSAYSTPRYNDPKYIIWSYRLYSDEGRTPKLLYNAHELFYKNGEFGYRVSFFIQNPKDRAKVNNLRIKTWKDRLSDDVTLSDALGMFYKIGPIVQKSENLYYFDAYVDKAHLDKEREGDRDTAYYREDIIIEHEGKETGMRFWERIALR